jgi:hypothetical protein
LVPITQAQEGFLAIECSFCGSPLKDDARYCNRCGTLIASHPFSPRSSSSAGAASDKAGRAKFEQFAGQSPNSAARRVTQDEPPSWMSQLENGLRSKVSSGGLESVPQEKAPEIAKAFMPEPVQHTDAQLRNLRVQVWEQNEAVTHIANGQSAEDDLEELPTSPLVASVSEGSNAPVSTPDEVEHEHFDGVEYVDTARLPTQLWKKPMATPMPVDQTMQQQEQFLRHHFESYGRSSNQSFAPVSAMYPRQESQPAASAASAAPPAQEWRQTPPLQAVVTPLKGARQRKKGKTLVRILVVCFLLVVLGGLGAWLILYHPFSVPGITQPQQSFTDSQSGFSLSYPNGWQTQVDKGKTTVHFYDSSHTAQVDVVVGSTAGGDPGAYLRQKANQLGLTGLKNSSTSIGGASWQRIQGNVLIKGASYTETLLAIVHKNSIYTIILLAPQSIFEQEEQLVFAKMYSSFQFL